MTEYTAPTVSRHMATLSANAYIEQAGEPVKGSNGRPARLFVVTGEGRVYYNQLTEQLRADVDSLA